MGDTLKFYKKPLILLVILSLTCNFNGCTVILIYSNNIFLEYTTLEKATLLTNVVMWI